MIAATQFKRVSNALAAAESSVRSALMPADQQASVMSRAFDASGAPRALRPSFYVPRLEGLTSHVRASDTLGATVANMARALTQTDSDGRPYLYEQTPNSGPVLDELHARSGAGRTSDWCGQFATWAIREAQRVSGQPSELTLSQSASRMWSSNPERQVPRDQIFALLEEGYDLRGSVVVMEGHMGILTGWSLANRSLEFANGNTERRRIQGAYVQDILTSEQREVTDRDRWNRMEGFGLVLVRPLNELR